MRRLMKRLRSERGASAVLFGLLLIPLLGFAGIAVDVGALYAEKAELQNGADAAALEVAIACANDEASSACLSADPSAIAGANDSNDGVEIAQAPDVDTVNNVVTVVTNTEDIGVRHPLASMLPGIGESTVVHAEGAAEWGVPVSGTTIPLAIAECELADRLSSIDATTPTQIIIRSDTTAPCPSGPPGGFGWLSDDDCSVTIGDDAVVVGTPGNNPNGTGCDAADLDLLGKTILVPLYDLYAGTGFSSVDPGRYTISRFAAFYVTGTKFGTPPVTRYLAGSPATPTFTGPSRGLRGYFVRYVSLEEAFELGDATPDYGSKIVRLTLP